MKMTSPRGRDPQRGRRPADVAIHRGQNRDKPGALAAMTCGLIDPGQI